MLIKKENSLYAEFIGVPFSALLILLCSFIFVGSSIAQAPKDKTAKVISRDGDISDNNIQNNRKTDSSSDAQKKDQAELIKKIEELSARIKSLEAGQVGEYDDEQKKLLLSLDILTKTEQRAENLRKKLIDLIEKESTIKTRLEVVEYSLRPEIITRSTAIFGSLRPEDIREQKKKNLESEKRNLESLLTQIQASRTNLENSVRKADIWVEKVRIKFEKQIDKALEINSN